MVNRPAKICRMLAAGLALALAGCSKIVAPVEADGLGLPKVELRLTSEDYGTLNSNVYARLQVPAELQLEGRRWQIKVRYSGQTSINNTKKSVTFEFPEERRFRGHRFYGLSAQSGDPTGFNPIIGFYAFAQAGLQTPEVQPVTFYVNGEYWGLYFLIEPIDEDFFARRGQRLGTLYEATRANALLSFAEGYDVRMGFENKGEREDYFGDLEKTIRVLDESQPQELPARLAPLVDAENWLRYLAVSVLLHNFDGYINNYRLHKSRPEDPFRIIPWDADHLLEIHPTRSSIFGEPKFSERLLRAPEYRRRYREILLELMDATLRVERLDAVLDETAAQIAQALAHDRFLGGDAYANAARRKESLRQWYAKIRADLVLLE
ncbi:MAG: hypothetical protein DKINENOH_05441 [bacterium]|nr:hypothetical protein [bacterium]